MHRAGIKNYTFSFYKDKKTSRRGSAICLVTIVLSIIRSSRRATISLIYFPALRKYWKPCLDVRSKKTRRNDGKNLDYNLVCPLHERSEKENRDPSANISQNKTASEGIERVKRDRISAIKDAKMALAVSDFILSVISGCINV